MSPIEGIHEEEVFKFMETFKEIPAAVLSAELRPSTLMEQTLEGSRRLGSGNRRKVVAIDFTGAGKARFPAPTRLSSSCARMKPSTATPSAIFAAEASSKGNPSSFGRHVDPWDTTFRRV